MKTVFLAVCVLCVSSLVLAKPSFEHAVPLEGVWSVQVIPEEASAKAGEKNFEDTLTFKDGKFRSEACILHGFDWTKYKLEDRPEITVFIASAKNPDKGSSTEWIGSVNGQRLTGSLTWQKPDGSVGHYTFEGKKN